MLGYANKIIIYKKIEIPKPGEMVTMAITKPYIIVKIKSKIVKRQIKCSVFRAEKQNAVCGFIKSFEITHSFELFLFYNKINDRCI